jgi:hypothetical protein
MHDKSIESRNASHLLTFEPFILLKFKRFTLHLNAAS